MFECLKQLVRALIPLPAVFAQRFADNLLKLGGSVRDVMRERRWLFFKDRRHHLSWGVAREWHMAGYHFTKNHAETPIITGCINFRAARLLRRHITGRPEYGPQIGLDQ